MSAYVDDFAMAPQQQAAGPPVPSFIGGAARKRRLELAAEHGLLGPGYRGPGSVKAAANGMMPQAPAGVVPPTAKKAARPAPRAMAPGPKTGARWIQIGEDSPLVLEQGLPELAPSLTHEPEFGNLLSGSTNLLWDIAGESAGEIELKHDADWSEFPDVGDAIKRAGGEEQPMCIAILPSQGKWAVGAAGNWKKREQAARLALCVALAANIEDFQSLAATQPEFTMFCEASGIATDTNLGQERGAMLAPGPEFGAELDSPLPAKKQKVKAAAAELPKLVATGDVTKLPRETPMWIVVEDAMPDVLAAMAPEALAVCTDGSARKGLYSSAERALAVLLENPAAVEYLDDVNWDTFPAVGNALKQIAPSEECLTVAVCAEKDIWAVGVGMKGKSRWSAAKAALATALALRAADEGEEVDFSDCTAIQEFAEEARAARDA